MKQTPSTERYGTMLLMRQFDEACLEGVPTFEIHGELHTGIGQEAIGAGMLGILRDGDALVSTHRNHFHAIAKGVPVRDLLAEIMRRKRAFAVGEEVTCTHSIPSVIFRQLELLEPLYP